MELDKIQIGADGKMVLGPDVLVAKMFVVVSPVMAMSVLGVSVAMMDFDLVVVVVTFVVSVVH